jgi:AraC-like DNA-binding protein
MLLCQDKYDVNTMTRTLKSATLSLVSDKNYYNLPINAILLPYLHKIEITFANNQPSNNAQPYTILPDIYAVMGIQTTGRLYQLNNTKCKLLSRSGISGIQSSYRIFQPAQPQTKSILIKFKPWALTQFFSDSAQQFYNNAIGMADIVRDAISAELEEKLAELNEPLIISQVIQDFLIQRLLANQHKPPQKNLIALTNNIITKAHSTSIEQLAKEYGFSKRNLERHFQTYIGISPKKFAMLVRFQKILQGIKQGAHWQVLAERLDFYDQAHFINEFKQFAGLTPVQFIKQSSY